MRALWSNPKSDQAASPQGDAAAQRGLFEAKPMATGEPLQVPLDLLDEDPDNPRTEFPQAELYELAQDIAERGVLQPIVVDAANAAGRYRIRFGAKRWRAARQAGLAMVPITIATQAHDAYAQVAENQKRHGLTPLDLARFIRGRVDAGESNATIAKRLAMDQTTIAHHLALLSLPPVLSAALQAGRCISPRSLYELSKLHEDQPQRVAELIASDRAITREAVGALRAAGSEAARVPSVDQALTTKPTLPPPSPSEQLAPAAAASLAPEPAPSVESRPSQALPPTQTARLYVQANTLCDQLDATLTRLMQTSDEAEPEQLAGLSQRLTELARRLGP